MRSLLCAGGVVVDVGRQVQPVPVDEMAADALVSLANLLEPLFDRVRERLQELGTAAEQAETRIDLPVTVDGRPGPSIDAVVSGETLLSLESADLALAPMNDTLINRARGLAKLLELMSAGLTVVAGRVGQAAEYIEDGRSGVLVPPHNPAALARAVLALLEDQSTRAELGRSARERVVQHYNWDRLALAAEAAYTLPIPR